MLLTKYGIKFVKMQFTVFSLLKSTYFYTNLDLERKKKKALDLM